MSEIAILAQTCNTNTQESLRPLRLQSQSQTEEKKRLKEKGIGMYFLYRKKKVSNAYIY